MLHRERFTEKAYRAIVFARSESSPRGPQPVQPEHILLGLLRSDPELFRLLSSGETDVVGVIHRALKAFISNRRKSWVSKDLWSYAPSTEKIVEFAANESQRLGQELIGTEHLLLGLLLSEHQSEPPRMLGLLKRRPISVSEVLRMHGFDPEAVAAQINSGNITPQTIEADGGPVLRGKSSRTGRGANI
jgi:ATP-dependent Clp protease ATP-binding subunit ClpC